MKKSSKWIIIAAVALCFIVILTLGNYHFAEVNTGGSDFLVHWMGTRTFLTEGVSPYSDTTALKIQTMAYGRPAQPGEHELRVAYPLYSIFFFTPFALIANFTIARACWMTVLELCLLAIAILSMRLAYWKPKPLIFGMLLLFTIFSYNGIRPLINGNAVIVVTLLVVLSLLLIRNGNDEIAGILLAFSTIKPQNVILLIAFILLWALFNRRYRLLGYFFGSMIILVGFSTLLIPDWILQNYKEIIRYPAYNPPGTVGAVMTARWGSAGKRLSMAFSVILSILLGLEWWKGRHAEKRYFLWVSLLTLTVSQWIGIQTDPGNFILLYPAIFFSLEMINERWKQKNNLSLIIILITITVGIWVLFLVTLQKSYQPIQNPIMFFPLPFIVFILLYWVRWWVTTSKKVDYSETLFEI